jgi:hypothetical protein
MKQRGADLFSDKFEVDFLFETMKWEAKSRGMRRRNKYFIRIQKG